MAKVSLNPVYIEATTLPDSWFQIIWNLLDHGREFVIDRGSYAGQKRLELDYVTVHIKHPGVRPLLPDIPAHLGIPNPVADDYLDDYLPYLMTPHKEPDEDYTYGERLAGGMGIDQIQTVIDTYKLHGFRNNQMVMTVGMPTDLTLEDPPCLRQIDTRIQDNRIHFFVYFRSWDAWNGYPANLGGIQLLKEYMASEIGVEDGEMIVASKGLHIYDYAFDLARMRTYRTSECEKSANQ
ncbi:MAG: thymidylate synthase [Deltaproteobacteria bacterium]|nr:MAG: thymidylate synthase [Deltaproteobacteria bacterium]